MSRGRFRLSVRTRWILGLLLVLALLPALQSLAVRWIDPPFTSLMCLRSIEARWDRKEHRRAYTWRKLDHFPRVCVTTILVAEDQRFFTHGGFDWKEVKAARARAAKRGTPVRGASTITMQCARTLFLWPGRSWIRKGLEAYYTFWLELLVPKRRILELYINTAELGNGVYGVEAAAGYYFKVRAPQLTGDQCAKLAALLGAPRTWEPDRPSEAYQRRYLHIRRETPSAVIPGWTLSLE